MMLVLAAAALIVPAHEGPLRAGRLPADFDLADTDSRAITRDQAAPAEPQLPANMDTRDFAVDPEVQWPLAENGPVILLGAMGGKHGDEYRDMPKLAHVALGWNF